LDASNQFDANDLRRAQTENVLANLYALQGELKLAGTLYEESLAILQANGEAGNSLLPFVLGGLGELRLEEAHWMEAEQLLQQSKALQTELHGDESTDNDRGNSPWRTIRLYGATSRGGKPV
jgi:hypothetical protein